MRIAVIDCGTNTFNLLIAEKNGDQVQFIFEDKIPVKIGKGGIENKTIVPDAYQRALDAMTCYALSIKKYQAEKIIATSTSAFRSTDNGPQLIKDILKQTGIHVEMISGGKEAEYIYKGVTWAYPPVQGETHLIMDIGGGSTEFILYDAEKIFFKDSYLLGASRLLEKFKPNDPLTSKDIETYYNYFEEVLNDSLIMVCKNHPPDILIGSSGFFDTLRKICFYEFKCPSERQGWAGKNASQLNDLNCDIKLEEFNHWYKKMLPMNIDHRRNIEGMTKFRAEMMGVSMLLVDYIIKNTGVEKIINTSYALKEGVLREVVE